MSACLFLYILTLCTVSQFAPRPDKCISAYFAKTKGGTLLEKGRRFGAEDLFLDEKLKKLQNLAMQIISSHGTIELDLS